MFPLVRAEVRSAVINKQSGELSVIEGYREDFVALANFTDDIKTSGWVDLRDTVQKLNMRL